MNKGNRLQQLEDACRDIIKIHFLHIPSIMSAVGTGLLLQP